MVNLEGDPKKLSRKRGSERRRERSPWGVSHEQVTSVASDPSGEPCKTANCRQPSTQAHSLQGEEEVGVFSICFPCDRSWAALSDISSGFLLALCVGWSCSWWENPSRRVIMSPVESHWYLSERWVSRGYSWVLTAGAQKGRAYLENKELNSWAGTGPCLELGTQVPLEA